MTPTPEDWKHYYRELNAFTMRRQQTKPRRHKYATIEEYREVLRRWEFEFHTDKPNPPGYEYANNH